MKQRFTHPKSSRLIGWLAILVGVGFWSLLSLAFGLFGGDLANGRLVVLCLTPFLWLSAVWGVYVILTADDWVEFSAETLTVNHRGKTKTLFYREVMRISQNPFWITLHFSTNQLKIDKQLPDLKLIHQLLESRIPLLTQIEKTRIEAPLPLKLPGKVSQLLFLVFLILLFTVMGGGMAGLAITGGMSLDTVVLLVCAICLLGMGGIFARGLVQDYPVYCLFEKERIVWQRPFRRLELNAKEMREVWLDRQIIRSKNGTQEIIRLFIGFENGRFLTLQQNYIAYPFPKLLDVLEFHYHIPIQRNRMREDVPHQRFALGSNQEFSWYFTGQSQVTTSSVNDICYWLRGCEYIHDHKLFNQDDHWQHPTDFERTRQGDCEDHALWAWRKIAELGLRTEFVVGTYKNHDETNTSHAWVVFEMDNRYYLLETTEKGKQMTFPLATMQKKYIPHYSVDYNFRTYRYSPINK